MKSNSQTRKFRKLNILSGVCLAVAVLGAPAPASAQEAAPAGGEEKSAVKYNRKSGKVRTKDTLDTKFKEEKERQEKEKTKKEESTRDKDKETKQGKKTRDRE